MTFSASNTTKSYKIGGLVIPVVTGEACFLLIQYGKGQRLDCACSRCVVRNAGMTQEQIKARMDKAHGVAV